MSESIESGANGRECPEWCPQESWEVLSDLERVRLPKTLVGLLSSWRDYEAIRTMVADVLDRPRLPVGYSANRISLVEAKGRERQYLAIIDATRGETEFSLFHRGDGAFRTLVMCLWRSLQEEGDWKKRERRSSGSSDVSKAPQGFQDL